MGIASHSVRAGRGEQSMRAHVLLRRAPTEATRAFHARFLACEQQLARLGLIVYTGESRAIKWLNGMDKPLKQKG
eukprot:981222-Amphidinium_carterae.11